MTKLAAFIHALKREAWTGFWNGTEEAALTPVIMKGKTRESYFMRCRMVDFKLGIVGIFTRDVGYHSSGWWKNPDYERCYHLSLSFFDPESRQARPRDKGLTAMVLDGLFARDKRLIWCEPPYTAEGKRDDVWHYRLFCDKAWTPIKPRGEVYGKELTEANWLSWSDYQALVSAEVAGGVVIPEPNRNESMASNH